MIHQQFYEELGTFLYALAKVDGTVQQKEIAEVEKSILHLLRKHKHFKDHPEYKELILSKLSFDNCLRKNLSLHEAQFSFTDFLKKQHKQIDGYMKQLAMSLINHTAHAYHGINKAEEKLIREVIELLETH